MKNKEGVVGKVTFEEGLDPDKIYSEGLKELFISLVKEIQNNNEYTVVSDQGTWSTPWWPHFGCIDPTGGVLPFTKEVGIAKKVVNPDKILFKTRGYDFIGVLHFDFGVKGSEERKWLLEIYGREYIEELEKFTEKISEEHGVNIEAKLIQEKPCVAYKYRHHHPD